MIKATRKWLIIKISSGLLIPFMTWFIINCVYLFNANNSQLIDFLSNEWTRNTIVSLLYILLVLLIGRLLSYKQRLFLAKSIAILLIITTVTGHARNIANGYWNISENLPLHLCGISNLIACLNSRFSEDRPRTTCEFNPRSPSQPFT